MKKILILSLMCFLLIPSFASAKSTSSVDQEKGYPTAKEIAEINEALDELVVEANKKLETGQTEISLKKEIGKTNETVSLFFKSENVLSNSLGIQPYDASSSKSKYPSGKKIYKAYVKNTAGFDFQHRLAGEFQFKGGKVTGATTDVNLTGAMYSESHKTWIDKLDPSVWVVQSHGTFKAFKFLFEYNTYLTVKLLGSGDYRIERASIGF
ncbi:MULTISPECIES: hypothetical protein [Bacillus]|uniref:hypothetical protein n=1 Tax=Bacillus TaxID=1386 RepID=UPI000BA64C8B|nr:MULTISPECIES: hypothetical protein [Bacillus]PAC81737.1 hypothetical protein CHI05_10015 [Bacillus sp. 7788]QNP16221.1 hypothetical protein H9S87_17140 [Bacillus pumilus]